MLRPLARASARCRASSSRMPGWISSVLSLLVRICADVAQELVLLHQPLDALALVVGQLQPQADLAGHAPADVLVAVKGVAVRRPADGARLADVVQQGGERQRKRDGLGPSRSSTRRTCSHRSPARRAAGAGCPAAAGRPVGRGSPAAGPSSAAVPASRLRPAQVHEQPHAAARLAIDQHLRSSSAMRSALTTRDLRRPCLDGRRRGRVDGQVEARWPGARPAAAAACPR